jgi:polar amino acid transport system substrate-binding protein
MPRQAENDKEENRMPHWLYTRRMGILAVLVAAAVAIPVAGGLVTPASAACPVRAPSGLVNPGYLTVGTSFGGPPGGFLENGKPTGDEVEIAEALAAQMCLKARFVNLNFAGLFPALSARKFDIAMAGIGITKQREQAYDFVPYFLGGIRLVVRKGSGLYFHDERALCGYAVATLAGSVEAHDLEKYNATCPADRKMDIRIFPSNPEVLEQLRKGTVKVAFIDWNLAAYDVLKNPDTYAIGSPVLTGEAPGQPRHRDGIMLRKGNTALKAALTQALANIEKDGTYQQILARWNLEDGDIRKAQ